MVEEKRNGLKLLLLMGLLAAAGGILLTAESIRAKAYQYARVEPFAASEQECYLFLPSWADYEQEAKRYEGQEITLLQAEALPSVEIWTKGLSFSEILEDPEAVTEGKLTITLADGTRSYQGKAEELKGRGNSTWALDKKPLQFKLSEEADLFGMGEAKTWVLLANGFDETGIRNSIGLQLASDAGLSFTPETVPVDLYCDGVYQGCYLLSEKVQVQENRVDIGNGFLLERELTERWETAVYLEGKTGFQTTRGDCYLIEFPKEPTESQTEQVRRLVQEAEDAVFAEDGRSPETGRAWQDCLDQASFVRKYLLEEVTKNYDGGVTSAFYYVPEGEEKLYAGPAWDYDVIFGNCTLDEMNSNPQGITELSDHISGSDLYAALMDQEDFRQAVFSCFEEVYVPLLEALLEGGIRELAGQTEASVKMDHLRWSQMENRYQYYTSYEDNLRYLEFFVEKRLDFLKEVWTGGEIYRTVTLQVQDSDWRKFYVKDGGLLGELPVPFLNDSLFIGWYRSDGKRYDPYRPIYEDMEFEARWQQIDTLH